MIDPTTGQSWMAHQGPAPVPGPGPCAHRAAVLRLATPCGAPHPALGKLGSCGPGGTGSEPWVDPLHATATLTRREREVLALVARGWSDGTIATHLFISKKTASVHVANIKDKLGTCNRVETALIGLRLARDVPGT